MAKITDYAEELLQGTDELLWLARTSKNPTKKLDRKSEGMNFSFGIEDREAMIDVFTTRLDTIMGVSFIYIIISFSNFQIFQLKEMILKNLLKNK